jgi:CheY-like chemotaxis protein/tRNA A-37 threonylcarbamoyl transferase component Bud32
VLAADDDAMVLDALCQWLEVDNHSIETAYNGKDCWDKLKSQPYDLVILDWDMPFMTGIDVLKSFREAGGSTPVIMLTGHADVDDKEKGFDLGADDYLTKPFQGKELLARVRALLRRLEQKGPKPLGLGNEQLLKNAGLFGTSLAARYEFLDILGEGAAGIVFKAKHPQLDKLVAIKMLHYHGMIDDVYARFEQEAKMVSRLNHPGIAMVYDFGVTEQKRPYMVMEYVEGKNLARVIEERDHLPAGEALTVFVQICDAMAHAHEKGIVHRDIKPVNILINQTSAEPLSVKVLDFGCGKLRDLHNESSGLTQEGKSLGTPSYMSPEQVRGMKIDERSDVYSLGCVMYETLTGYVMHQGDNAAQTMLMHLEEDPPLLHEINPDLTYPEGVQKIVSQSLERDLDKRYQSMRSLQEDLKSLLDSLD